MKSLSVVVVQASARGRQAFRRQIEGTQGVDCRAALGSRAAAEKRLRTTAPCVVLLDLELARVPDDASLLAFIDACFAGGHRVVLSSEYPWQAYADLHGALAMRGIHGVVAKPRPDTTEADANQDLALLTALRAAAGPSSKSPVIVDARSPRSPSADKLPVRSALSPRPRSIRVIAMGASTGGPKAIETVLQGLSGDLPPILIAQHIAVDHSRGFAEQLNGVCGLDVCEAEDGQRLQPGQVLIAPSHAHLRLRVHKTTIVADVDPGPPVHRHRPSIDVMFDAVADCFGATSIGVLMTGMGQDGAQGLKKMHDRGAHTIVQDASTSVVYGMPKRAQALGAADLELAIDAIAPAIRERIHLTRRRS